MWSGLNLLAISIKKCFMTRNISLAIRNLKRVTEIIGCTISFSRFELIVKSGLDGAMV